MLEFIQRPRFTTAFPIGMSPTQFVDTLFSNAVMVHTPADYNKAINEFAIASGRERSTRRLPLAVLTADVYRHRFGP